MTKELGFSDEVFGFGAGIFFIGYVLLEIPGTILVERWSARKWISRIMITWGFFAAFTGMIHTKPEFYVARFMLGVAEAGFFPGVIVYLSHWFRQADRGRATAMFTAAIPVSQIVGAPLSAALLKIHWLGWPGWRWLLVLEGIPAVILGIVTLYYLTDRPRNAKWLPDDEREWLTNELEKERAAITAKHKHSIWQAFAHRDVVLLTIVYFFGTNISYGLQFWLPKMIQKMRGFDDLTVTLLSMIPFLAAWPFTIFWGWNSDRMKERRWHTAGALFIGGVGFALSVSTNNVYLGIAAFTIAAMGISARMPPFWSMPGTFLSGTAAAAVVGSINCVGNIGGFVGPYFIGWLSKETGSYQAGMLYMVGSAMAGGLIVLLVRPRRVC